MAKERQKQILRRVVYVAVIYALLGVAAYTNARVHLMIELIGPLVLVVMLPVRSEENL